MNQVFEKRLRMMQFGCVSPNQQHSASASVVVSPENESTTSSRLLSLQPPLCTQTSSNKINFLPSTSSNNILPSTSSSNNFLPSTSSNNNILPSTSSNKINILPSISSNNNILPSTSSNNNILPSTSSNKINFLPSTSSNNNILPSTSSNNNILPNNNNIPSTDSVSDPSKPMTFNFDEISPTTARHLQRYCMESDNAAANQENISSVFMGWTRDICHNSADNHSPQKNIYSDRFIPMRQGNNWDSQFAMISEEVTFQENTCVGTTPKKSQESDGNRDGVAYSCLLKNELLGMEIDDVKAQSDEKKAFGPVESNSLFKFASPKKNFLPVEGSSPYSLYPVSSLYPVTPKSQKLLRSPRKATRKISLVPFKVLDAPQLQDDFYLNLVDWSSQNVLSVALGSSVYLWSACTGQVDCLCDLSSDGNSVTSVSWNERGNLLAVGTQHGYVQVWDVVSNKQQMIKLQGHSARVGVLAWNGGVLSSGGRDRLILQQDVRTPSILPERKLVGHVQEVCGLKWSPDNQYLASGSNDNRLHVWNLHSLSPVQTYKEHVAAVKAIAWSPHHHGLLASGGGTADRCIRFWNTLTGQPMQCVDTGSQVCNLAWSKHSSELVSTHGYSQNQILVWKYPSLSQVAKLTGHSYRVVYLATSPDGEAIVTGAGDETLRFWNVFSKARSHKENKSVLNLFNNIR